MCRKGAATNFLAIVYVSRLQVALEMQAVHMHGVTHLIRTYSIALLKALLSTRKMQLCAK